MENLFPLRPTVHVIYFTYKQKCNGKFQLAKLLDRTSISTNRKVRLLKIYLKLKEEARLIESTGIRVARSFAMSRDHMRYPNLIFGYILIRSMLCKLCNTETIFKYQFLILMHRPNLNLYLEAKQDTIIILYTTL